MHSFSLNNFGFSLLLVVFLPSNSYSNLVVLFFLLLLLHNVEYRDSLNFLTITLTQYYWLDLGEGTFQTLPNFTCLQHGSINQYLITDYLNRFGTSCVHTLYQSVTTEDVVILDYKLAKTDR